MRVQGETVSISRSRYIYRSRHLTMEGGCAVDHGPRVVNIPSLRVDVFPVTNRFYAQFLQATGYRPREKRSFLRHWNGMVIPDGLEDFPVVWVSIEDAAAYAAWNGGRLPTDEEWQFFAAGPDHNTWPWGDVFNAAYCNHDGPHLRSVTAYPDGASWCGCRDLCGNAWEWTSPIHDDGRHCFALLRGGSFFHAHDHWHIAGGARPCDFHWKLQMLNQEINRAATLGFRCVYEDR